MSDLPAPFVAAFVDLSNFEYMPLDVRRLRDSRLAASANGDEFRSAVLLWCASWHQKPAASLPDDEIELAQLAGYGRVVKEWRKVSVGALSGWVKCSDGRLYHPVVAEKALEAWDQKAINAWDRECDRIRKENKRRKESRQEELIIPARPPKNSGKPVDGIPAELPVFSTGIPPENALKGTDLNGTDIDSVADATDGDRVAPVLQPELLGVVQDIPADMVKIWREELPTLPQPSKITVPRRAALLNRMRETFKSLPAWRAYCQRIRGSPFLMGEENGWRADLDFALTPSKVTKVLEGAYDRARTGGNQNKDYPSGPTFT